MSYDDDLGLRRPRHVNREQWATSLARYSAAIALHTKMVNEISHQLAAGLDLTEDQERAEESAYDLLERARAALLHLVGQPRDEGDVRQSIGSIRDALRFRIHPSQRS